jgi:hypothetical protein
MAALFYWDGNAWLPIATGGGGGGGIGPPGPAGADGISINVSGPQPAPPLNPRKGDQWIDSTVAKMPDGVAPMPSPPPEPLIVKLLPDPPATVYVTYLP